MGSEVGKFLVFVMKGRPVRRRRIVSDRVGDLGLCKIFSTRAGGVGSLGGGGEEVTDLARLVGTGGGQVGISYCLGGSRGRRTRIVGRLGGGRHKGIKCSERGHDGTWFVFRVEGLLQGGENTLTLLIFPSSKISEPNF